MPLSSTILFDNCLVEVWEEERSLITKFFDGTSVPAAPYNQEEIAANLGYKDPWDMVREHEILHTFLSQVIGLSVSPTLWDVAHNKDISQTRKTLFPKEEWVVTEFQKYLNGEIYDTYIWNEFKNCIDDSEIGKLANKALDLLDMEKDS